MSIKNALLLHLSGKKPNTGKSVPAKAIAQQALEPRLLLDAAAVSTLAEATGDVANDDNLNSACLLYTSPSPRDATLSRMPSSA